MDNQKENKEINKSLTLNNVEEDVIDIGEIFRIYLGKIHYIIMMFMVGALLFNLYTYLRVPPTYSSTSKLYIVSSASDSVVDLSSLTVGSELTADYEELLMSYPILDTVIEDLGWDTTAEELASHIALGNSEGTRVLSIKATCRNPQDAKDLANALAEAAVEYIPDTMGTVAPNIAQKARLETAKVGPNYVKKTLFGGIAFAGLYCAFILVMFLLDDTVKSEEDIEKIFGMQPLSSIPESDIFVEDEGNDVMKKYMFWKRGIK